QNIGGHHILVKRICRTEDPVERIGYPDSGCDKTQIPDQISLSQLIYKSVSKRQRRAVIRQRGLKDELWIFTTAGKLIGDPEIGRGCIHTTFLIFLAGVQSKNDQYRNEYVKRGIQGRRFYVFIFSIQNHPFILSSRKDIPL